VDCGALCAALMDRRLVGLVAALDAKGDLSDERTGDSTTTKLQMYLRSSDGRSSRCGTLVAVDWSLVAAAVVVARPCRCCDAECDLMGNKKLCKRGSPCSAIWSFTWVVAEARLDAASEMHASACLNSDTVEGVYGQACVFSSVKAVSHFFPDLLSSPGL
jgi:hypothetical protein